MTNDLVKEVFLNIKDLLAFEVNKIIKPADVINKAQRIQHGASLACWPKV